MDSNGSMDGKSYLDLAIEKKYPRQKGIRKSKFFEKKEGCWFLVREIDKKNLYQIFAIKETEKQVRIYTFFDSKVAGFTLSEEFTLQSTREKVKDLLRRCEVGWKDCPVEIIQKEKLNQSEDTTM